MHFINAFAQIAALKEETAGMNLGSEVKPLGGSVTYWGWPHWGHGAYGTWVGCREERQIVLFGAHDENEGVHDL